MKTLISLACAMLFLINSFAQSPEKISYQSIVRDTTGKVIVNQLVAMKISLLKKTINGTVVYSETHRPKANANGLVTLQIGDGDVVFGDFSNINWGDGPFYLKTQVDPSGDSTKTTYTISGTTQLLSVPYALYANSASLRVSEIGDTLFSGKNYVLIPGISKANEIVGDSNRPTVVTDTAFNITASSVELTASVTDSGASAVTARGVCYATSSSPDLGDNVVDGGSGIGTFSVTLNDFEPGTQYYARAYARNTSGVAYGNEITLNSSPDTVVIGSQVWSTLNLDVIKYRNGDPIPHVTDSTEWANLGTGAWCWYNNDSATYASTYGRLYNWYAVNDPRGLSPNGWHVPNAAEWDTLVTYLGGRNIAGGALKEAGTKNFLGPNPTSNSSGFKALPGGMREIDGTFTYIKVNGSFWDSSDDNTVNAYCNMVNYGGMDVARNYSGKCRGFSVRCIKDSN